MSSIENAILSSPCGRAAARGVTLVELLVTVTVLAIMMAIAAPSFRTFTANRAISSASDDLVSALRQARSEALTRGSNVVVCATTNSNASSPSCGASSNWKSGWLVFADLNSNNAYATGDVLIQVGAPTSSGSLGTVSESGANSFASFRPNGLAGGSRTFVLTANPSNDTTTRKVCLSAAGRVTLVTGASTACPS